MMIRFLALDLDGTLTNSEKRITPRTRQALMQAQERGVCLILCSGRPLQGQQFLADELQLQQHGGYIIAYNGASIVECATGREIDHITLPQPLLREIVQSAIDNHFDILTYQGDSILTNNAQSPYAQYSARNNHMTLCEKPDLVAALTTHVPKFIILGQPERLAAFEPIMKQHYAGRLSIMRSEPFFLEMMPLGVDKGESLARLMHLLGASREELMAFGDGFNDCGMLHYAGIGVAMANAQQAAKDVADFVTLSNDEDGVVHALQHFHV